jgi:hypothetical protein
MAVQENGNRGEPASFWYVFPALAFITGAALMTAPRFDGDNWIVADWYRNFRLSIASKLGHNAKTNNAPVANQTDVAIDQIELDRNGKISNADFRLVGSLDAKGDVALRWVATGYQYAQDREKLISAGMFGCGVTLDGAPPYQYFAIYAADSPTVSFGAVPEALTPEIWKLQKECRSLLSHAKHGITPGLLNRPNLSLAASGVFQPAQTVSVPAGPK